MRVTTFFWCQVTGWIRVADTPRSDLAVENLSKRRALVSDASSFLFSSTPKLIEKHFCHRLGSQKGTEWAVPSTDKQTLQSFLGLSCNHYLHFICAKILSGQSRILISLSKLSAPLESLPYANDITEPGLSVISRKGLGQAVVPRRPTPCGHALPNNARPDPTMMGTERSIAV